MYYSLMWGYYMDEIVIYNEGTDTFWRWRRTGEDAYKLIDMGTEMVCD